VAEMVTKRMFAELLLESGRYEHPFDISESDSVELVFNTVDTDELVKKEAHAMNKMASGIITTSEAREMLGMRPLEESEMKSIHTVMMTKILNDQNLEVAKATIAMQPKVVGTAVQKTTSTKPKTTGGNQKKSKDKTSGANNANKSIASPKNQHSKVGDMIHELIDYASGSATHDIIMSRFLRDLPDISILTLSCGIIDANDYYPKEIESMVVIALLSVDDTMLDNKLTLHGKKRKIKKTIDNMCSLVNNMANRV